MNASVAMQQSGAPLHLPDHLGKLPVVVARSPSPDENSASPVVLAPVDEVARANDKLHPLAPVDIWQSGFYTAWERKKVRKKRRNRMTWMPTGIFFQFKTFPSLTTPSLLPLHPPTSLDLPRPALLL